MGTEKRERQKANRAAKLEREAAENRKVETKQKAKSWVYVVAGIAGLIALGLLINFCTSRNDNTTTATTATTATTVPTLSWDDELAAAGLEAPGETEAVEPVCPATDGSAERTLNFTGTFEDCLTDGMAYRTVWTTNQGTVTVEMDTDTAPNAATQVISLARYKYYDQTAIQRIAPSIDIIQGGSPHTQTNGDPGPGFRIDDEGGEFTYENGSGTGPFEYGPGELVLARTGEENGSGPQFFFTTGDLAAGLNGSSGAPGGGTYIRVGKVTEGLDVLQAIQALHDPTKEAGRPSETVVVESVEVIEYDPAAETPSTTAAPTSEAPTDDSTSQETVDEAPEGE